MWAVSLSWGGALVVLAAETDWTKPLVDIGIAGVLLVLFILGIVTSGKHLDRMERRAEAAETREREMRDRIDDKILPLLGDVARELKDLADTRRRGR